MDDSISLHISIVSLQTPVNKARLLNNETDFKTVTYFTNYFIYAFPSPVLQINFHVHNINSQLDAKITHFIDNYNQLNMFRATISPILRSTWLCLQLVV